MKRDADLHAATAEFLERPADASDDTRPGLFSDDALALGFTKKYGRDLRYTAAHGQWALWDGCRWKRDDSLHVFDLARGICRAAASVCENARAASRIESAVTVAAVERLARADRQHAATVDQWDRDPWRLNTPSGIVDLKSGGIQRAKREDYCTKVTTAAPGGDCPLWNSFLSRVTDGKSDLQEFIQRVVGYTLTGVTSESAFFSFTGGEPMGKASF